MAAQGNIKDSQAMPTVELVEGAYSKMSRSDFPPDFAFGTGTSAYQNEGATFEGGRGPSIWDVFTQMTPRRIADGSNGNVAVDMYHKYEEDIKMMKNIGFDAYRFSISWTRILPAGRASLGVNREGIAFYNNVINCLLANGIEPYVTLFHWDLPQCLEQEYQGFLHENVVKDFCEFAELCFSEFGDRVKNWFTLNEPWTYAVMGYVISNFPPSVEKRNVVSNASAGLPNDRSSVDSKPGKNHLLTYRAVAHPRLIIPLNLSNDDNKYDGDFKPKRDPAKDVYTVGRNLLLAHAHVVDSYRNKFQDRQGGKIGITLVSHWFEPYNEGNMQDVFAAIRARDFMLGWFLEPVLIGQYPKSMISNVPRDNLEPFSEDESKLLKGSIDFLGLNYYTAVYAANDDSSNANPFPYYIHQKLRTSAERDGIPIGPQAGSPWLNIVPYGIYKLLIYIKDTYQNSKLPPIYITENGVDETSDRGLTDTVRVNYHRDHLAYILKAIKKKVNVKGYFIWSWCDNFEWANGYTVRFGIIYIDFKNHLTRHLKDSAFWFTKFLNKE